MSFDPPLTSFEIEKAFNGTYIKCAPIFVGGQGAVFKADFTSANPPQKVALKLYHPGQIEERNQREVLALQQLKCSSLVELIESGTITLRNECCPYMATKFVEGLSLLNLVQKGPCDTKQVVQIGIDVASAIDCIWSARIVHRDIKPPNVMITKSGNAILIDLGVARYLGMESLTTDGKTFGTSGYLSPEQMRCIKQLSCKSDVFALGIMLQECLLGRHPTRHKQLPLSAGGPKTEIILPNLDSKFAQLITNMVHVKAVLRPSPSVIVETLQTMR